MNVHDRDWRFLMLTRAFLVSAVLAVVVLGATSGCTTTPDRVESRAASYDGGEANSGILALEKGGAVVTQKFVARYQSLLREYRKAFLPAMDPDDGIANRPDGTRFITNEVLERMILISEWRRLGRKPD